VDGIQRCIRNQSTMRTCTGRPHGIKVGQSKWQLPCDRAPLRRHSEKKQVEIRKQVDALLKLGVIQESQATEWSQFTLNPNQMVPGDSL